MLDQDVGFSVNRTGSNIDRITTIHLRNKLVNAVREHQGSFDEKFFEITDKQMSDSIINTYGDELNREILRLVTSTPHTVMEIISKCNDPQTSIYRRILKLIKNDFLIQVDSGRKERSKESKRYMSTFRNVFFHISEDGNSKVMTQLQTWPKTRII